MVHFSARASSVLRHGISAWNPLVPGGMPSAASLFPSYSLPTLLSTFCPLWVINHLWNMLVLFLFGYGTYRVAHEYFDISRQSALLAGAFSLAPVLYGNPQILFSFAFPLFFAWTHDLCKGGLPLGKRLALVAGLLCLTASSYPMLTLPLYPIFHLLFYLAFFWNRPELKRNVAAIFLVWTGYVLFFTPTIVSLLSYVPYSQRDFVAGYSSLALATANYLMEIRSSLRVDNVLLPMLLVLFFAFRNSIPRRLLFFVVGLLMLGSFFRSDFRLLLAGTVLTKMDLRLAGTMIAFPLTVCLGLVLDRLRKGLLELPWYWWVLTVALAVLLLKNEARIIRNLLVVVEIVLAALLLVDSSKAKASSVVPIKTASCTRLLVAALCGCLALSVMLGRQSALIFGQTRIAQVLNNHSQLRGLKQESDSAPFRVGSMDLHPAISASYGLETVDGRGPLFNRHFKENVRLAIAPQLHNPEVARSFATFWYALTLAPNTSEGYPRYDQTFGVTPHNADDLNILMLQSLNVRYLLTGRPVDGLERFATLAFVDKGDALPGPLHGTRLNANYELPIYGYRLNDTLARGRIATRTLDFAQRETALAALGSLDLETRRNTVVLLDADRGDLPALSGGATGTATLRNYTPDNIDYDCSVDGPGYLVISNNYDPGWQATLDGAPTKIIRADNAFQAIFLPQAGRHQVRLSFNPPLQRASEAAALVGLVMICSMAFMGTRTKTKQTSKTTPLWGKPQPPRQQGGLSPALLGGGFAAGLWALGYALFILRRFPYPHEPAQYALVMTPIAGVLAALVLGRVFTKR